MTGFPSFFSKVSQLSGRGPVPNHAAAFGEAERDYHIWSSVQGIQAQWVHGRLTPDEALAALMTQGRDEATSHKILRSWGQPLITQSAILSKGWSKETKNLMADLRKKYYAGEVDRQIAMEALQYMGGLSESTSGQVINKWEDLSPGFEGMAEGFEGLGEESVVLRPNQKHREKRRAKAAEDARLRAIQEREEAAQGNLFSGSASASSFSKYPKYWVSPDLKTVYPVDTPEHSHYLKAHPEIFGEFSTSEDPLYDAMDAGWVRVAIAGYEVNIDIETDLANLGPKLKKILELLPFPIKGFYKVQVVATNDEMGVKNLEFYAEDILDGNASHSGVGWSARNNPLLMSASRYNIACHFASPLVRPLIASRLSGRIDDTLMAAYKSGLGDGTPNPNLRSVGPKGAVTLNFDIGNTSEHRTSVDLGGNLETGYVVNSIADDLGIFPEGTEDGDFIEASVVQNILRQQGLQDNPDSNDGFVNSSFDPSQGFATASLTVVTDEPPNANNPPSERATRGANGIPVNAVKRYSGATPTINDLANLVNCVQGDIHFIHFYASGNGQPGWDELHNMAGDYYEQLGKDYDDLCELSLQRGEDITPPNLSAPAIGYESCGCVRNGGFTYGEAMVNFQTLITEILDYANDLKWLWADSGAVSATALVAYLDDFIMRWSKEAEYKLARRLHQPTSSQEASLIVTGSDGVLPVEVPTLPFGEVVVGALPTGESSAVVGVVSSPVTSSFAYHRANYGKVPVVSARLTLKGQLLRSDSALLQEMAPALRAVEHIPEFAYDSSAQRDGMHLLMFQLPGIVRDVKLTVSVGVSRMGKVVEIVSINGTVETKSLTVASWEEVTAMLTDSGERLMARGYYGNNNG